MYVPVRINGQTLQFVVDTGTTQILMDVGAATRIGLHATLGHTVAQRVEVGNAVATNLPLQTVNLFGGALDGILGNEFFGGHIVHLDYSRDLLELIAPGDFFPPAGARRLDVDCDEGMPIVAASVAGVTGTRFAIDTGSSALVLTDPFARRVGSGLATLPGGDVELHYLEGLVDVRSAQLQSLAFAGVLFTHPGAADVEVPLASNVDIPLDAIVGAEVLRTFEWWFDYDHNRAWVRYVGVR
jgi:hypothetical protein